MKGCMVLTKGLMDWEKLLKEELCWDFWMKDWKVGAICWKAAETRKSSASRNHNQLDTWGYTYERQFHQMHHQSWIGSFASPG